MTTINQKLKGLLATLAITSAAVGGLFAVPAAQAATGAGASILNVVRVDYTDAGGNPYAETAAAAITVNLVPSTPILSAPVDQIDIASASTATYTYQVTSTANGNDTYDISAVVAGAVDMTSPSATPSVASVTLGASVIIAVPTVGQVLVPAGSETNLAVNDVVVVNGTDYLITAIAPGTPATHTNVAPNDGTAGTVVAEVSTLITLGANPAGSNLSPVFGPTLISTIIAEQASFTVDVTGTVAIAGSGTVPVDTTAASATDALQFATDQTITTFTGTILTITKEVSTDGATGATYATSTSANSGSTLVYRIIVTNSGSDASNVVVQDPIPDYTSYVANSGKLHNSVVNYASAGTALTDAADAPTDAYDESLGTVTLTVGDLLSGETVVLFYQVTID